MMRHLSLFSGIGGIDLGFDRAGMETVGQVEWDEKCRSVLERWWPDVPRWGDVREVHGPTGCGERVLSDRRQPRHPIRPSIAPAERRDGGWDSVAASHSDYGGTCDRCLPDFDVLTGGFPCQDISVAGKRAGLAGDRSGLWHQFARIIAETSPRWVVIENVPGLLSSNRGRDMGTILGFLGQHGYGFAYRVLDAQWFGVAQRRRRVFIVGHFGGDDASKVLAVGQGSAGHPAPSREAGSFATQAFTRSTFGGGGADDNRAQAGFLVPAWVPQTAGSLRSTDYKGPKIDIVEPSLISFNWQTGHGQYEPNGETVGTLHKGQTPAVSLASQVRRLTPVECARLQGFPDDWNDHLSDTQRYRQFGNAVCVNVAEWVGRRIMEVEHAA